MSDRPSGRSPHEPVLRELLLLKADISRSYGPNLFVGHIEDGSMLVVRSWLNIGGDDLQEKHQYTAVEARELIDDINSIEI